MKGSLYVTVPGDMPAGAADVCFVRSDSQVNEKSNLLSVQIVP